MFDTPLTPARLLREQREYVKSVAAFAKPAKMGRLEAIAADDAENSLAAYFTDIYVPTSFMMIFMVYSEDDNKIAKRFSDSYSSMGHEFLAINDFCNLTGMSVLKIAKNVKKLALPYIKQGKNPDIRYEFEKNVSDTGVELRATYLSKLSDKAQTTTINDYFLQIGLSI
jgi:hypothetical protein